jgi:hypothetical protein
MRPESLREFEYPTGPAWNNARRPTPIIDREAR